LHVLLCTWTVTLGVSNFRPCGVVVNCVVLIVVQVERDWLHDFYCC